MILWRCYFQIFGCMPDTICPQEDFQNQWQINIPQISMHTTVAVVLKSLSSRKQSTYFRSGALEKKTKAGTWFSGDARKISCTNGETEVFAAVEMNAHNFIGSSTGNDKP